MINKIKIRFLLMLLLLTICVVAGCSKAEIGELNNLEKSKIEVEVKNFWKERRPGENINGFSYQKFSDTLVLVGVTFEDQQTNALNVVARKFENDSNSTWKIEPFNDKWKGILRLEPEQ